MCDGKGNCCHSCNCCKCNEIRKAYLKIDSRCMTKRESDLAIQTFSCGETCNCCTCYKVAKKYAKEERCMKKKRSGQKSRESVSASVELVVETSEKKLHSGKTSPDVKIPASSSKAPAAAVAGPSSVEVKVKEPPTIEEAKTGSPGPPEEQKITPVPVSVTGASSGKPRPIEEPKVKLSSAVETDTAKSEEKKITPVPVDVAAASSPKPQPTEDLKVKPPEEPKTTPAPVAATATSTGKPQPLEEPKVKIEEPKVRPPEQPKITPVPVAATASSTGKPQPIEEHKVKIEEPKVKPPEEPKITPTPLVATATSTGKPQPIEEPKVKIEEPKIKPPEEPKITPVPVAVPATSTGKPLPIEEPKVKIEEPKVKPPEEPKITPTPLVATATSTGKPLPIEEPKVKIEERKVKPPEEPKITPSPPIPAPVTVVGDRMDKGKPEITVKPLRLEEGVGVSVTIPLVAVVERTGTQKDRPKDEGKVRTCPANCNCCEDKKQIPDNEKKPRIEEPKKQEKICLCSKVFNIKEEQTKSVVPQIEITKPQQTAKVCESSASEERESKWGLTRRIERPQEKVRRERQESSQSEDTDKEWLTRKIPRPEKEERVHRTEAVPLSPREEPKKEERICVCPKTSPIKEEQTKNIVPQIEIIKPQPTAKVSDSSASEEQDSKWGLTRRIERPQEKVRLERRESSRSEDTDKGWLTRKIPRPEKEERVHLTEALPPSPREEPKKEERICVCPKASPIKEEQVKNIVPQIEITKPQQTAKVSDSSASEERESKWGLTRRIERPQEKVRGERRESSQSEDTDKGSLTRKIPRPEKEERVHRTEAVPASPREEPKKEERICVCPKTSPIKEEQTKNIVPQIEITKPQPTAKVSDSSASEERESKWGLTRRIERPQEKVRLERRESSQSEDTDKGWLTRKIPRPEKEERVHRIEAVPPSPREEPKKEERICVCPKTSPIKEEQTKNIVTQIEITKPQPTAKVSDSSASEERESKWGLTRRIERPQEKVRGERRESSQSEDTDKGSLTRKIPRPEKEERVHRIEAVPPSPREEPKKEERICVCPKTSPIKEEQTKNIVPQIEITKPQPTAKVSDSSASEERESKWGLTRRIERPQEKLRGERRESSQSEDTDKGSLTRKIPRPEKEERVHRTEAVPSSLREEPKKEEPKKVEPKKEEPKKEEPKKEEPKREAPALEDRTKNDVTQVETVKPQQSVKILPPSDLSEDNNRPNLTRNFERPQSAGKVALTRAFDCPTKIFHDCNCISPTDTQKQTAQVPAVFYEDVDQNSRGLTRKIQRPSEERLAKMKGDHTSARGLTIGFERPIKSDGDYSRNARKHEKKAISPLSIFRRFMQIFCRSKKSAKPYVCKAGSACNCCDRE